MTRRRRRQWRSTTNRVSARRRHRGGGRVARLRPSDGKSRSGDVAGGTGRRLRHRGARLCQYEPRTGVSRRHRLHVRRDQYRRDRSIGTAARSAPRARRSRSFPPRVSRASPFPRNPTPCSCSISAERGSNVITAQAITDWLAASPAAGDAPEILRSIELDHDFSDVAGAARRGASMLAVTADGRFLALAASDAEPAKALYIFSIGDLISGAVVPTNPDKESRSIHGAHRRAELEPRRHHPVPDDEQRPDATRLWRYQFEEGTRKRSLRAAASELAAAPLDLAVSPGERWAFLLTRSDARADRTRRHRHGARQGAFGGWPAGQPDRPSGDPHRRRRPQPRARPARHAALRRRSDSKPRDCSRPRAGGGDRDRRSRLRRAFREPLEACPACRPATTPRRHPCPTCPAYIFADLPRIEDPGNGVPDASRSTTSPTARSCRRRLDAARGRRMHPCPGDRRRPAGTARRTRPAGPAGQSGAAGRAGSVGEQGPQGDPGPAGTGIADVRLEILPPGSTPTVTVTQVTEGLVVTIGLPDTSQRPELNQIVALELDSQRAVSGRHRPRGVRRYDE